MVRLTSSLQTDCNKMPYIVMGIDILIAKVAHSILVL